MNKRQIGSIALSTFLTLLITGCAGSGSYKSTTETWSTDLAKAQQEAASSGKYILANFSGSDWCGWCVKLDKEVFSKKSFQDFSAQSLVPVLLDFPRRKPQSDEVKKNNAELAKKYGVKGFPTILVLAADGSLVGKTGYQPGGSENYVEHLKEIIEKHKAGQKKTE